MTRRKISHAEYEALAEFRLQIRQFLRFSEQAAREVGLEPQQHQLMLALKARSRIAPVTIKEIAELLLIHQQSAVGLVDRAEARGWVVRRRSEVDRREVFVDLTPEGETILAALSEIHRAELRSAGPRLIESLRRLVESDPE